MADVEINKPKTEKTSASLTSTLPRLCRTTKLPTKEISCNTQNQKSPSPRNRPSSDEVKKRPGLGELTKTNLHKSILTEFINSDQFRYKNVSLTAISPRDYRGLIPIPTKHLNSVGMSPPVTRSPSPIKKFSPKELKASNKIKTITLEENAKKKPKTDSSRSPSPIKRTQASYKKPNSRSTSSSTLKNPEKTTIIKRNEGQKPSISPRTTTPTKRKTKAKVSSSSNMEYLVKDSLRKSENRVSGEADSLLKQSSQPTLCKKEILLQPQGKISLDHIKNEVYTGDHKRLSFEKVQLSIENSLDNLGLAESKRSYMVTYSADNLKKQKGISLAFVQNISSKSITNLTSGSIKPEVLLESKNTIRTVSGEELYLSPSMKLDVDKGEVNDLEISKLLHNSGKNFEEQEVHILQDDANEYDSEISTDGEASEQLSEGSRNMLDDGNKKTAHSIWKSREAELLNDVDYRQSVYHPAVSRRNERSKVDFRPKSKSIEDNYGFDSDGKERIVRSRSTQLKNKYTSQIFAVDKDDNSNDRSWCTAYDKTGGLPMFKTSVQEVPLYGSITGVERIRTKKQRVSGALLRFTVKIIRLLALFNLWPGDFCHMLTSQSLRLAR
ncbi:hypothetical protein RUM44_013502 [Polyplax serrata]|uniref:Uncharacterized protein n=1 Tax=Polyplax serrata TaxID=468196 RepID=A0ABR1BIH1_POLSC